MIEIYWFDKGYKCNPEDIDSGTREAVEQGLADVTFTAASDNYDLTPEYLEGEGVRIDLNVFPEGNAICRVLAFDRKKFIPEMVRIPEDKPTLTFFDQGRIYNVVTFKQGRSPRPTG